MRHKKAITLFLIIFFVISPFSFSDIYAFSQVADTENIVGYQEWNQSRTVTKNVIIATGATLVIGKGVEIAFTTPLIGIDVQGTLIVNGTTSEPTTFNGALAGNSFNITSEPDSKVFVRNAKIINGGYQAFQVRKASNTALAVNFKGAIQADGGSVSIQSTTFKNNSAAVIVSSADADVHVNHSSFANNEADVYSDFGSDFRYNWWGEATGPEQICYESSPGVNYCYYPKISGNVDFSDWLATEDLTIGASNVLFLPGLEASRLYQGDNQLWEPNRDGDVEKLSLDGNGKSQNADVFTKDVVDEVNISPLGQSNIYKSFLNDLAKWKNDEKIIADYAVAPYDWRLILDDILNGGKVTESDHISYVGESIGPYIIRKLRDLAMSSKSGKVTIVAHSNGGLVAKALVSKLGAEAEGLIDKIVFVAVPQVGTPQAIGGLLNGFDQGLPKDWMPFFLSPKIAREFANNMPSAYHLLPSESYFNGVSTPVIKFEDGALTQNWIGKYGNEIDNANELTDFLKDSEQKVASDSNDLSNPASVNANLLDYGNSVHSALDNWTAPFPISVYQIAGFGEETLGAVEYWTGKECVLASFGVCLKEQAKIQFTPQMVIDGDGTVVAPSALAMKNVSRYWVDLFDYNDSHIDRSHADILEVENLRNFIKNNILTQSTSVLPVDISDVKPLYTGPMNRLQYILHSPLDLSVKDNSGNVVSATVSNIPDATFKRFGEVQYISLPKGVPHTVMLNGVSEGSFTLEARKMEGENVLATANFSAVPSTADTEASMAVSDGTLESAAPLLVDYDGNGAVDFSLEPKIVETVVDQNPPEAKISFNPETNSIIAEGIDENPTKVVYSTVEKVGKNKKQKDRTTTATITDQVGNTTVIIWTESNFEKNPWKSTFNIDSISYNGTVVGDFQMMAMKYKWKMVGEKYKMFATHFKTASQAVESHYRPKKDITVVMSKPQELDDKDTDDDVDARPVKQKLPGLVVPWLTTVQGKINVNY